MQLSAYWWNSTVSASMAFFAWTATASSCFFSSSLRRRWTSTIFLCSCASFRAAWFFSSSSSCSCLSSTWHHSPRNLAVSASSARSRSRWFRFRSIWATRLFWMSWPHLWCSASFSWRFLSSPSAFCWTWLSTRSSSSSCISARRFAWASIIAFRASCFCWKTSSSFCFLSVSILSFLTAYSWIFSSSRCSRRASPALHCLR
mmetsp:Transcript_14749/g.42239  ORF Transcript_14749/g.42239 Transcript_14749/m.42239 type:complete len:202 (+) Transcript_14749:184-789(+)